MYGWGPTGDCGGPTGACGGPTGACAGPTGACAGATGACPEPEPVPVAAHQVAPAGATVCRSCGVGPVPAWPSGADSGGGAGRDAAAATEDGMSTVGPAPGAGAADGGAAGGGAADPGASGVPELTGVAVVFSHQRS